MPSLLIESTSDELDIQLLEESDNSGKKSLFIEGVTIACNRANKNGRVYLKENISSAVSDFITKSNNGNAFGTLGHQGSQLNPMEISHRFVNLRWHGDNVIGKAKVLDTPAGRTLEGLLKGGGRLGFSTKGLGSVKANDEGLHEVQSDYRLISADVVTDPSSSQHVRTLEEGVAFPGFHDPLWAEMLGSISEDNRLNLFNKLLKTVGEKHRALVSASTPPPKLKPAVETEPKLKTGTVVTPHSRSDGNPSSAQLTSR